jgi:hypothetical protein
VHPRDYTRPEDNDVPQELQGIHRRYISDGEAWRRSLPSTDRLARFALEQQDEKRYQARKFDLHTIYERGKDIMYQRKLTIGISAVAFVLVMLFTSAILHARAGGKNEAAPPTPTPVSTATSVPCSTATPTQIPTPPSTSTSHSVPAPTSTSIPGSSPTTLCPTPTPIPWPTSTPVPTVKPGSTPTPIPTPTSTPSGH